MDQISLVDRYINDGRNLVLQLVRDGFEVAAAFWLKTPEKDRWHLCIASKVWDQFGPREAYGKIRASHQKLPGTRVSLTDITAIGATDPLTRAVRKLQREIGELEPISLRNRLLGTTVVEEAYMYPLFGEARNAPLTVGKRKIKTDVELTETGESGTCNSPLEGRFFAQIVASGASPAQADYWVRKRRGLGEPSRVIPAGTIVTTWLASWWGKKPEDDPNPLLWVETADGSKGLTFMSNTEPV